MLAVGVGRSHMSQGVRCGSLVKAMHRWRFSRSQTGSTRLYPVARKGIGAGLPRHQALAGGVGAELRRPLRALTQVSLPTLLDTRVDGHRFAHRRGMLHSPLGDPARLGHACEVNVAATLRRV